MKMKSQYLPRFADLYERQGRRVELMDDKLWVNYGRMIVPIGPINMDYSISEGQARQLMKMVPGSLMVRYTHGYQEPARCEDWYAVICDEFKDLSKFRSEHRRQIKKGLDNCEVRQVDADFIAGCGYDVYLSAFSRYKGGINPIDKSKFLKVIGATKEFDDIYQYWGAFYSDKLIAYSMMAIFGNEEAEISVTKINPEYLNLYPYSSLIYTILEHYLSKLSTRYVNSGFRSVYHETSVQEMLIKKLSFKKKSLSLVVTYNYLLQLCLNSTYPFRNMLRKANYKLGAMYTLEEIRRKCQLEKLKEAI